LKAAEVEPLGKQQYTLVGVNVFDPSSRVGQKVTVKGALIKSTAEDRINVTSLQKLADGCSGASSN
jgi:hypothetical protein